MIIIYIYITSGTYDLMKKLEKKHLSEKMILMQNVHTCQLLHETSGKTFFNAARKYEVIHSEGDYGHNGIIAFNNIEVRDEARPVFEYGLTERVPLLHGQPGFKAIRLLRPLTGNTYSIMTMWDNENTFEDWKHSKEYDKISNGFFGPSHFFTFYVHDEELEMEEDKQEKDNDADW